MKTGCQKQVEECSTSLNSFWFKILSASSKTRSIAIYCHTQDGAFRQIEEQWIRLLYRGDQRFKIHAFELLRQKIARSGITAVADISLLTKAFSIAGRFRSMAL